MSFNLTRRGFMVGCSSAIAALAGSRLNLVALADPSQLSTHEILVVVFLRGGIDGLSLISPLSGSDRGVYESARPDLLVPTSGANSALSLGTMGGAAELGLHPAAAPLLELYQADRLAVIHAAGLTSDTRSHFDAMEYMERGTPGNKSTTTGWLTRHLSSAPSLPSGIVLPALAATTLPPVSLQGRNDTVATTDPDNFSFWGHWEHRDAQRAALRQMYAGSSWLHDAGVQTLDAIDIVESHVPEDYLPGNGALYPDNSFGRQLQVIAQIVKAQLGLQVATIDLGGWDTHEYQGEDGGGYFYDVVETLSQGLHALYTDLDGSGSEDYTSRLTVAVMSEFGRTLRQNNSRGTDHGHGNVMMLLGGSVNGGQLHGQWPGLGPGQLYDGRDLAITTDYRQVLSEILIRRLGNPNLGQIFPGYTNYQPLGVVQGTDLPPNYEGGGGSTPPLDHQLYVPSLVR